MLINPPTKEEMCTMARSSAKYGSNSVFKGLSDVQIDKLVSERVETIGPITLSAITTNEE